MKTFAAFDVILAGAVKGGSVDYAAVAKRTVQLDALLRSVAIAEVSALSADERLAFYINSYNALVLRSFLAHGNKRVSDVAGFFDKETFVVAKETLTLNLLEERKIRRLDQAGVSADPRIHFVVNCASRDCPPLAAKAYRGDTLSSALEAQTRAFLTRPNEVSVDAKGKRVVVVQLFEWYASDFGGEKAVRSFIARYVPAVKDQVVDETWDLDYRPYDWTPNAL